MLYLVTYDIDDDKIRNKISKILEGFGVRVQESVFECNLNKEEYDKLLKRLTKFSRENFNIRIYPLCKDCYSKAVGIGEIKIFPGLKGYEIV